MNYAETWTCELTGTTSSVQSSVHFVEFLHRRTLYSQQDSVLLWCMLTSWDDSDQPSCFYIGNIKRNIIQKGKQINSHTHVL
jgi:hypothetical protein